VLVILRQVGAVCVQCHIGVVHLFVRILHEVGDNGNAVLLGGLLGFFLLNPWWVRKLFFIVDSYKRFHPMGSTFSCLSTSRLQLFFSRTQAGLLNIRLYKLMSTLLYKKS
jgi:hypothetical protein